MRIFFFLNLGQWFLQPICSADQNGVCDCGKDLYEDHVEFEPVVKGRCCLTICSAEWIGL